MRKRNLISGIILTCGFIALMLWLYVRVIEIGDKLALTHEYLKYGFYVVSALFVLWFIVRPFFQVVFAPSYSLVKIHDFNDENLTLEKQKQNYPELVKVAKRLEHRNLVSVETEKKLDEALHNKEKDFSLKYTKLKNAVDSAIKDDLKADIRKIIITTARDTLYFTAISQNGFADVLIVMINNFRQIKKIVRRCGFRPSFFRLLKIYINVMISCFIAEGIEEADLSNIFGGALKGLSKNIVGSLMNGAVNSFFMLRVGFLTQKLIFEEHDNETKEINLLKTAFVEAAAALPELTIATILDPIINILKGTIITPTKNLLKRVFKNDDPYPKLETKEE